MKNIIFAGMSIFSYIILNNLLKKNIKIKNIIYSIKKINNLLDKKISIITKKYNINTHNIKNLLNKKSIFLIKNLQPQMIIVASYGAIFPNKVLKIPNIGCINIHASLLPELRGASPIQKTIINNKKYTGITIIIMNQKIDDGKIIYKNIITTKYNFTTQQINEKLAHLASKMLIKNLKNIKLIIDKNFKQNKHLISQTNKIKKLDGKINWNIKANKINQQIKAYFIWPSSFTFYNLKKIQIIETNIQIKNINYKPGQIIKINKKGIYVSTKKNIIIIKKLKIENKKTITTILNNTKQFKLGSFFK